MTFAELNAAVAAAVLGSVKLTGLNKGIHTIALDGDVISIVTPKGVKVAITERGLASLRIVVSEEKAKLSANTRDAKVSENYTSLQKALEAENVTLTEATKLELVHKLPIYDSVLEQTVLTNDSYKGYPEFVKSTRRAMAIGGGKKKLTEAETAERTLAFSEANDSLRSSGYKAGVVPTETNTMTMPVFVIK